MENQILATCPAGYSAQGNTYGEWFCNGEWCKPWDPFSIAKMLGMYTFIVFVIRMALLMTCTLVPRLNAHVND